MKKTLKKCLSVTLLLCLSAIFASCSSVGEDASLLFDISEASFESSELKESGITLKIRELKSLALSVEIDATESESLSEEDCVELAKKYYPDVRSILSEFYGNPKFLKRVGKGPYPAGEVFYSRVELSPSDKMVSSIVFENDAAKLRELLNEYFTDDLIEKAFSLEYPCPIYEKDGVLYRTIFEEGNGYHACDLEAGRIISKENGFVRFGFPIYSIDFESNEISDKDFWVFGYFDFVYEDSAWKINDLRLSGEQYSYNDFPVGCADIRMDGFFEIGDEYNQNGVAVELKDDANATVAFDDKTLNLKLTNRASSIKKAENVGGNIFVSFNCIFDESETVVISESDGKVIAQFVSNGYCTAQNGDWYYIKLDRKTRACDVYDRNNNAVCEICAIRQPDAVYKSLPEIASIASFSLEADGFSIIYNETPYKQIDSSANKTN